jgi:hypothetical protein
MSMQRVKKRMADGSIKIYEYQPRSYYQTEVDRARKYLMRRPLKMAHTPHNHSVRWTGGNGWPSFSDLTITKLIAEGYAVCLGNFVERKGVKR